MANEYLREYQLPNVDNSDSTDEWVNWFTTGGLPTISRIEANWTWHDQGWGNQKGRIRAVLVRGGQDVATVDIGPIAGHESRNEHFVTNQGNLIDQSKDGDELRFEYVVGGGGGHTLHIENFKTKVYPRIIRVYQLPNVQNTHSTDDWVDWFTVEAVPPVSRIEADWTWRDQGWGNQKGTIRAVLIRGGQEIATLQIGPIAGHESKNEHFVANDGALIDQSQAGDSVKFQYVVGGGGGHELYIENFIVKIFARPEVFQLPNVDNTNSTDDWVDWFTTGPLAGISKIEANWTWRDQGWGNLKGRIRAVLLRGGNEVATLQIGPIAAHESRAEHFATSKGDLIDQSQDGDVLKFQYIVGGGGGHSLHIENFTVKIYPRSLREYQLVNVDNSDSTDNWIDWFTTGALFPIARIEATWSWHDQGWGNQKGTIRAVLIRGGQEIATLQIGPIAGHEARAEHFVATRGELFDQSRNGDSLKFQYLVGGGGGHTLHIENFIVKIFPRVLLEFQLPNVANTNSTDDWVDWFTTGGLPAITRFEANWTWRDQGWGNLKGRIRATLIRGGHELVSVQVGPIAGHENAPEHFVATEGELIDQSQDGDELKFQYVVGGGGGHELLIENFGAKIFG